MDPHSISESQQKIVDENLIAAIWDADREKADLCLRKGANIDTRSTWYGRTALMIAVTRGSEDLVTFLLERKADVFVKDENGKTAFDLVSEISDSTRRKKINRLLLNALPDAETPAAETPAARDDIAVLKPIEFDRRKKSGGSFQL